MSPEVGPEPKLTNRERCELNPERFCRAEIRRGRYTWVCYGKPEHNGPHMAGNSDNEPIHMRWFDVIDGGVK